MTPPLVAKLSCELKLPHGEVNSIMPVLFVPVLFVFLSFHDIERELLIRKLVWDVIRFSGSDVEADPEAVARAVFKRMGMQLEFKKRRATGSGMMATKRSAVGRPSPQSRLRPSLGRVISK